MNYPIFNSLVNQIEAELYKRNIKIETFKTWNENTINATGLELVIDIQDMSDYIKSVTLNFDWDKFREISLAKQLNGMKKHPLLIEKPLVPTSIKPTIDIEIAWIFDINKVEEIGDTKTGNYRLELASQWMENINQRVTHLFLTDNIITRWHVEVEGDLHGRYLSEMRLMSYFQYTFENLK
ncbi:MAG TPA: hypothetical protein VKA34_21015, partial [Balneolales bacterium]|nr:hypothetical protein [Balneolales bacterium]